MKKFLHVSILGIIAWAIFGSQSYAQETKGDKVIVQITRDGKIVTDTIFQLKEGQDPEAVKRVISHVLDGDIEIISGKEGHQKLVWVTSHAEDIDVKFDSIMKHEEKVIIITEKGDKDSEGHQKKIKVIVEGDDDVEILDDEDLEWIEEGDADNVDVYIIKKDDGTKVVKKMRVEVKVDEENDNDDNETTEPSQKTPPKVEKKKN